MTSSKRVLHTIYGGQFGSEGKGQIAHFLANNLEDMESPLFNIRVGAPNAGHTFYHNNKKVVVQTLPSSAYNHKPDGLSSSYIGPGGMIIMDLLKSELQRFYEVTGQPIALYIDEMVTVITEEHMATEAHLKGKIGSTGEGVGAATAAKVMRTKEDTILKNNEGAMGQLVAWNREPWGARVEVIERGFVVINSGITNADVILEGTQGVGLSLHTSGYWPFCTSRECTPQGILADSGINPWAFDTHNRIMVVRTFPIRVGGNSGDLPNEITWEELGLETGGYVNTPEITTVTKKQRRIARLDMASLRSAVALTGPTGIALTFLDYMFPDVCDAQSWADVKHQAEDYILWVEDELLVPVTHVSTGPGKTFATGHG